MTASLINPNSLMDMIMQQLGYQQPGAGAPGSPPQMRGTFDAGGAQPGSIALNPVSMPAQALPGLQTPQLDPQSQFTRASDAPPFAVPQMGDARTPATMAPMGVPYSEPASAPQREASMTQDAGQMPAARTATPTKAQEPSLMSNVGTFLSSMRTGGLLTDIGAGMKAVEGRNATREFLAQKGLNNETIAAMEANPMIFQPVIADLFSSKTQVINNRLVNSRTGQIIADFSDYAMKGPDTKDFTLKDGSKVTAVWNAKTGRHELPNGQPVPSGASDTSGVPPGVDPKKYRETMATKMAERTASAATSLPSTLNMIDDQIRLIDDVGSEANKGTLSRAIGPVNSRMPTVRGDTADLEAKIKQLGGGAFLQAIPQIKGTGPMSNVEGERAMVAINRLQQLSQSDAGYAQALQEAKASLVRLRDVAQREARGDFSPRPTSQLPEGVTADQAKAEARAAIAAGKDRTAVLQRLQSFGLSLD